ncbi:hypothetical protein NFI96_019723, partial [Prochilodus magdalenae]
FEDFRNRQPPIYTVNTELSWLCGGAGCQVKKSQDDWKNIDYHFYAFGQYIRTIIKPPYWIIYRFYTGIINKCKSCITIYRQYIRTIIKPSYWIIYRFYTGIINKFTSAAPNPTIVQVSFTTSETFFSELSDSNSAAFRNRSELVKSQFEPVFQKAFPSSFRNLTVISFIIDYNDTSSNISDIYRHSSNYTLHHNTYPNKSHCCNNYSSYYHNYNNYYYSNNNNNYHYYYHYYYHYHYHYYYNYYNYYSNYYSNYYNNYSNYYSNYYYYHYYYYCSNYNTYANTSTSSCCCTDYHPGSFDKIYKLQYGILFVRTVVLGFKPGSTRASNVQADVQLIFNENSTTPIPAATEVVSTLKEAITNPNSGFTLPVDVNSIVVVSAPQTVGVIILTNGTFVTALSNSSTTLFTNRSLMIKSGLEPFFTADYPGAFSSLTLSNFSDGGLSSTGVNMIQNSMDLTFGATATVPNSTQIGQTIIRAAKNNTLPFQIFTSKIIVNGTVISSSEVSSKISMLTATFMVAISLLVTRSS